MTTWRSNLIQIEAVNLFGILPRPIHQGLPIGETFDFSKTLSLDSAKTVTVEIQLTISNITSVPRERLKLDSRLHSFGPCMNYSNQLDLWGPVNVPKNLPSGLKDANQTTTL